MPGRRKALGFTLIELVAILIILSALTAVAISGFRSSDASLLTSRDAIIAALSHAQQIAMARDSASNPITLVVTANSIEVRENGVVASSPGAEYPLSFTNGISITGGIGTYHYDKLGRATPAPTIISLNSGRGTVSLEASGYAH